MANGYSPYGIATTQQGLLENLLKTKQLQKKGEIATGQQKGEMTEEFEKEQISKKRELEALADKKRKGKWWEKLIPAVSMFAGPLAGGILSGLGGIGSMSSDVKFEKDRLKQMEKIGLGSVGKYGGTFLGSRGRELQSGQQSTIDAAKRSIQGIGGTDYLMKGLSEGLKGYSTGKAGEGVTKAFQGPLAPMTAEGGVDWDALDLLQSEEGGFFKKLFSGLSEGDLFDADMLGEGEENILHKLIYGLTQGGKE